MGQYLGLDSSTQSLSATVIDTDTGKVVLERRLNFGEHLPHYGAPNGFISDPDPALRHSDPLMWVEALEKLLRELRAAGLETSRIGGISGAGQQHGSVYLKRSLSKIGGWRTGSELVSQVRPLLSRPTSPIWMDSSTGEECAEIAATVGGNASVTRVTGSRAIERFTGPQIRKFFKRAPAAYGQTEEIHLVSSFMASVLIGATAGIDFGDGAGMNLLDLASAGWSQKMLDATAPGLGDKLPPPIPSHTRVGAVAEYFVEKHGFTSGTPVIAFTGDNPSSLVGMGASRPGAVVISLGTSDTVFAAMSQPRTDPRGYGHVFGNPAGGFMSLICFSNGSLAREEIRQRVGLEWEAFAQAIVHETRPGNAGNLMLPYFVPEITPRLADPKLQLFGSDDFVALRNPAAAARAVVEAQAVSMRHHSDWIGEERSTILATGGASRNVGILQVLADVFQAELRPLSVANSSALGGALRAAQAVEGCDWDELYAQFAAPDTDLCVHPNPNARAAYEELTEQFGQRLSSLLGD